MAIEWQDSSDGDRALQQLPPAPLRRRALATAPAGRGRGAHGLGLPAHDAAAARRRTPAPHGRDAAHRDARDARGGEAPVRQAEEGPGLHEALRGSSLSGEAQTQGVTRPLTTLRGSVAGQAADAPDLTDALEVPGRPAAEGGDPADLRGAWVAVRVQGPALP